MREGDRRLTQWMAGWRSPTVRHALSAVEETAESTKLWCGAATVMAGLGGRRGRSAAVAGLAAMAVAQLASKAGKPLAGRRRPPAEWIRHGEVEDRPGSSSFPSGHSAAAVAFTAAVVPAWPAALRRVHHTDGAGGRGTGAERRPLPSDAAGAAIGLASSWLVRAAPSLLRRWR